MKSLMTRTKKWNTTSVSYSLQKIQRPLVGIFEQQHMTIDRQVGYPVPVFDEMVAEVMEYVQLQFCWHRDCEWVLTV